MILIQENRLKHQTPGRSTPKFNTPQAIDTGAKIGTGVIIGYGIIKLIELGITIGAGGAAAPILVF